MSRCYPFPPPGYQKEVPAQQPPLDVAPTQVPQKEKHKHKDKDKEKKKKRKREEKDDNAHKEKRSSKNHKAAHSGVVNPGENGRVAEPSAFADNGQEGAVKASAPEREARPSRDGARSSSTSLQEVGRISSREAVKQGAVHEARISTTSQKVSSRDVKPSGPSESFRISLRPSKPAEKDAKTSARASSSAVKVSTQEVVVPGSAGRLQEGSNARPVSQEARRTSDKTGKQRAEKPASAASTSKYVVVDKEINGKVPSVRTQAEQDQQRQQPEQLQKSRQPQVQDQPQQQRQVQQQQQQQQRGGPTKEAPEQKEAQRSGGGGGGESEKREVGSSEKREKRSRLTELKLAEVPADVNNAYDDDYLEWLFPNKRRGEAKAESERAAESSRGAEEKQEVWADAVYLASVDVIALPYVVPY